MRKTTKVWLIIAASLVIIGFIIFTGVMTTLKWDFTRLSTFKLETNNYEIGQEFDNIHIKTDIVINVHITQTIAAHIFTTEACRQ